MAELQFAFPIMKAERLEDGRLMIEGVATSETPDKQDDVMDYNGSITAFGKWRGNVREAHDPTKMVGKALDWWPLPDQKAIGVRAFVSKGAPDTQAKVMDGTLSMFSVGGAAKRTTFEKSGEKRVRRVLEWDMTELSLVDSGANPDAGFQLVKADGIASEALAEEAEPVEKGDAPGHPFRGNQYTDAEGGGGDEEQAHYARVAAEHGAKMEAEKPGSFYRDKEQQEREAKQLAVSANRWSGSAAKTEGDHRKVAEKLRAEAAGINAKPASEDQRLREGSSGAKERQEKIDDLKMSADAHEKAANALAAVKATAGKMGIPENATDEFREAVAGRRDAWVPASGGHEKPFAAQSGRRLQYVFNPKSGKHAYYDVDSDIVLDDGEARMHLGKSEGTVEKEGTSEGAVKGWESRRTGAPAPEPSPVAAPQRAAAPAEEPAAPRTEPKPRILKPEDRPAWEKKQKPGKNLKATDEDDEEDEGPEGHEKMAARHRTAKRKALDAGDVEKARHHSVAERQHTKAALALRNSGEPNNITKQIAAEARAASAAAYNKEEKDMPDDQKAAPATEVVGKGARAKMVKEEGDVEEEPKVAPEEEKKPALPAPAKEGEEPPPTEDEDEEEEAPGEDDVDKGAPPPWLKDKIESKDEDEGEGEEKKGEPFGGKKAPPFEAKKEEDVEKAANRFAAALLSAVKNPVTKVAGKGRHADLIEKLREELGKCNDGTSSTKADEPKPSAEDEKFAETVEKAFSGLGSLQKRLESIEASITALTEKVEKADTVGGFERIEKSITAARPNQPDGEQTKREAEAFAKALGDVLSQEREKTSEVIGELTNQLKAVGEGVERILNAPIPGGPARLDVRKYATSPGYESVDPEALQRLETLKKLWDIAPDNVRSFLQPQMSIAIAAVEMRR